jgi:AcrR family transcriptional regulator
MVLAPPMKTTKRKEPPPPAGSKRREQALGTRRRILLAASELIGEIGYVATTMAAIAKRAGVAEQTLYFTFGSKPSIVNEALHAAVVGFDSWSPTLDRDVRHDHQATARAKFPWFEAFEAEADPRRALELYVAGAVEILGRTGPLLAAVSGLGLTELEPTLAGSEALRREASEMIVRALSAKGSGLRRGLSRRRAADIFHVLTSEPLHRQLTVGLGWSSAQFRSWLVQLLAEQLLAPKAEGAAAP